MGNYVQDMYMYSVIRERGTLNGDDTRMDKGEEDIFVGCQACPFTSQTFDPLIRPHWFP